MAKSEDAISIGSRVRSSMDGPDNGEGADTLGVAGAWRRWNSSGGLKVVVAPLREATLCACGNEDYHYAETAMDMVIHK